MGKTLEATLRVKVRAYFDDTESDEQTVRYLLEQDLEDAGWDCDVELVKENRTAKKLVTGKRLTNTGSNGEIWITDNDTTRSYGKEEAAYRKLKEYEDFEEQKKLFTVPCAAGETVYRIHEGRIFPMKVCDVNPFGAVRKGKVWNVYLEDKYTKAYRSFYDFGRTVFTDYDKAKEAIADAEARFAVVHGM